ncbi:GTP-binding protein [Pseudobacillus wudalianchiensis]|uniref:Elongation factor G n=1 Tax=Pseudobacillus wudalianchiensis TaxID=1743143 RepID=A0A1B9AG97_9BACI|nr:TetM/TetW/TetO/TetS family tetracycline resistance ribosomal protection protein [Bacillus wudalianchiensis]OCA82860.1 elongation factor G [Bacillus wudalianchiensis]
MKKTIGIFAHVDAGKTTFSEQLLYHTNSIKQRGRVDHQDAFLDSHEIERQRGITVFADQGRMSYGDSIYYLIDNPGHVDFSSEMERSIQVLDYAIIIISAVEGVEGHTETVWQLLSKHHIPVFFFINKIDRAGADVERVLEEIRTDLAEDAFDITEAFNEGEMSEDLVEFVAEREEALLEQYLERGYEKELWLDTMIQLIVERKIFPCASGSALQDIGIQAFLDKLDQLTVTDYSKDEPFSGRIYKVQHDQNGTRIAFIKAISGTLRVREEIKYGDDLTEKVTQIRHYNGSKFKTTDQAEAGELFAVTGLSKACAVDGVGLLKQKTAYEMVPTLKSKVMADSSVHIKEVLRCFHMLDIEDPSLNVIWEESLQEIHIHVMGAIQLEILKQVVQERFHFDVSFGDPEIIYKETIQKTVTGYGHFEPLGHYAEVHLKLEPAERNSGISFESGCHVNDLTIGNQNLVRHHLFEKEHNGLLTGSALTDVNITLLTGRAHNKHTSGGDFREAAYRALRQGLEKAENMLLEPYYQFKIKVELDQMGKVLADIQTAYGHFDPPKTEGDKAIITGKVPVATFMNYSTELAAFTQGKGMINLVFGGYDRCHNEQEVVERIGYNKDADPEYSSSSIFCSKGHGYTVAWDEAEAKMHGL